MLVALKLSTHGYFYNVNDKKFNLIIEIFFFWYLKNKYQFDGEI